MRRSALLDVDFLDPKAFGEEIGLDKGRIAFTQRNDVVGVQFGKNDFLFRPDAARPSGPRLEETFPFRRRPLL